MAGFWQHEADQSEGLTGGRTQPARQPRKRQTKQNPPQKKAAASKRRETPIGCGSRKDSRLVFSVGLGLTVSIQRADKQSKRGKRGKKNQKNNRRNSHMTYEGLVCSGSLLKVCAALHQVYAWMVERRRESGLISSSVSYWSDM